MKRSNTFLAILVLLVTACNIIQEDGPTPTQNPVAEPTFIDNRKEEKPLNKNDHSVLGVAFGAYYSNQDYIDYIYELGVRQTCINVHWEEIEPTPGNYDFTLIDSFISQLRDNTHALIRITARHSPWGTRDREKTVPENLSIGGPYYNFIYKVVQRANGNIKYFENEWEPDCSIHWTGTADEYAELTRTFYQAVKAADPEAIVIMGGTVGIAKECATSFFTDVFNNLAEDNSPNSFDMFDIHLYGDLYDIPDRIRWFRNALDSYPEFNSKSIVVTEYGGPSPNEFIYVDEAAYRSLFSKIRKDPCILATDLEGFPDQFRMFGYGDIGDELEAKRNRIQGRQMLQRTILSLSEGVEKLYWWNLKASKPRIGS
jgi:hypothetical protein